MSLPYATQKQIDDMNKIAEEKLKKDALAAQNNQSEQTTTEQVGTMNPMLAHHEEPVQEQIYEDQPVEESPEIEEVQEVEEAPVQESRKEYNLRMLRKQAEQAEYERFRAEKAERELAEYRTKYAQQSSVQKEEQEFSLDLDDESLVEGKHLKDILREVKNLRSTIKGYEKQNQQVASQTMEVRLQNKYPDINQVVTPENIEILKEMNPILADSIYNMSDKFNQAALAYDMIKQFGIHKDQSGFVQEKAIAQKNIAKPRPLNTISPTQTNTPLSRLNSFANAPLTKEVKDQHYQDMLQAMKGL